MQPKVLFYDIETSPCLAWVWSKWVDGSVIDMHSSWYIMCVAWKWAHQRKVHVAALPDYESYAEDPENDYHVVAKLWDLFDQADIVIAHNGDKFDMRKANARFLKQGLGAPSPVNQVDTLKVARKYFLFDSNRLDDLGKALDLGRKTPTGGFTLWRECMEGKKSAWDTMKKYNKQDVALLEDVYLAMRPWMRNHPSLNLIADEPWGCPICNAPVSKLTKRGFKHTKVSRFQQWQCAECGGYSRTRVKSGSAKVEIVGV